MFLESLIAFCFLILITLVVYSWRVSKRQQEGTFWGAVYPSPSLPHGHCGGAVPSLTLPYAHLSVHDLGFKCGADTAELPGTKATGGSFHTLLLCRVNFLPVSPLSLSSWTDTEGSCIPRGSPRQSQIFGLENMITIPIGKLLWNFHAPSKPHLKNACFDFHSCI